MRRAVVLRDLRAVFLLCVFLEEALFLAIIFSLLDRSGLKSLLLNRELITFSYPLIINIHKILIILKKKLF